VNIHAQLSDSRANGPGLRAVFFVQGCRLGCTGCWNPQTHAFNGTERPVKELAEWFRALQAASLIEGVTFSGGEPTHQIGELVELAERLRGGVRDLSLGMFSGYSEHELEAGSYWTRDPMDRAARVHRWSELRDLLDFAVLGRFNHRLPTLDPMLTSKNQRLRLYSTRYTDADFDAPHVEVTIEPHGLVEITGFPVSGLPG
jgi:anaerobic ribonucleoside-triphosphate reductase activating protein